jgi:hypothetical protein
MQFYRVVGFNLQWIFEQEMVPLKILFEGSWQANTYWLSRERATAVASLLSMATPEKPAYAAIDERGDLAGLSLGDSL